MKYRELLQTLKTTLIKLRSSGVLVAPNIEPERPQFGVLIVDPKMLDILERRWTETLACKRVRADLAATVMLGGLLEALFLARINRMPSRSPLFTSRAAPKDKAGNTKALKEWGLKTTWTWLRNSDGFVSRQRMLGKYSATTATTFTQKRSSRTVSPSTDKIRQCS